MLKTREELKLEEQEKRRQDKFMGEALCSIIRSLNLGLVPNEDAALELAGKTYDIPIERLRSERREQTGQSAAEAAREKRLRTQARIQSVGGG
jgi:hypothetical protein